MPHEGKPRVEGIVALGVLVYLACHGAYDRQVVGHFADLRKNGTYGHAALPPSLELEGAGEDVAVLVELCSLYLNGHGLTRIFLKFRFRVEGVDVGSSAGHVAEYDALGLGL